MSDAGSGRAGYDRAAAGYDARHDDPAGRRRTQRIDRALIEAIGDARVVLDLGCGTGRTSERVVQARPAARVVGIDVSAGMLIHARDRGLGVARADAATLPFADGTFDALVAAKGVFRYLDWDRAFAEAARVVRAGGILALHQYARQTWSPRGHTRIDVRVREVSCTDELVACAAAAGFQVRILRRWRPIRVPPYLVPVPDALDRLSPVTLWGHLVAGFSRGS